MQVVLPGVGTFTLPPAAHSAAVGAQISSHVVQLASAVPSTANVENQNAARVRDMTFEVYKKSGARI